MRSASAKSRERKEPTSSVVRGPPMFMKTIAVGPREEVASWVTGGTMVAIDRAGGWVGCLWVLCARAGRLLDIEGGETCLESRDIGFRSAMSDMGYTQTKI